MGVLDDAGEHGISHDKSTRATTLELMGENAEGVGIALKVGEVVPEDGAHQSLELAARPFEEVGLHGFLTAVAEGRIAQVVGQAGGGDDLSYLLEERVSQFGMALCELHGHVVAERHAHAGHFERMGEAVVDENAAR